MERHVGEGGRVAGGFAEAQVFTVQVGTFVHQDCVVLRPARKLAGDVRAPIGVLVHGLAGAQLFG